MVELFQENLIPEKTLTDVFQPTEPTWNGIAAGEESGKTFISPTIIGGTIEGATFKSAIGGARLEIFPKWDPNVGMIIYDDAASEVFKVLVGGTNVGDIVFGDSSSYYMQWDKSAGRLRIVGPTVTNIQGGSEISIQGWQHDMTFSAADHNTVAWASGTITLLDETTYSITGGNTGNMTALTWIYLDTATSETVLQTTTTASSAIGTGKIIICVAQNVAAGKKALFKAFAALGGTEKLVTYEDIAASTVTANEMNVNTLSAISANMGTITAGTLSTDVLIVGTNVVTAEARFNALFKDFVFVGSQNDGLTETDGTITRGPMETQLYVPGGSPNQDTCSLRSDSLCGHMLDYWNMDYEFIAIAELSYNTEQDAFWGLTDFLAVPAKCTNQNTNYGDYHNRR
jgi:hypothetical protein